jgi:hypothetical protein
MGRGWKGVSDAREGGMGSGSVLLEKMREGVS